MKKTIREKTSSLTSRSTEELPVRVLSSLEQAKLSDWKKKLKDLENVELPKAQGRLTEAAPSGDWQENAEYEDAERQVEILMARIADIKQVIVKMQKGIK